MSGDVKSLDLGGKSRLLWVTLDPLKRQLKAAVRADIKGRFAVG